MRAVQWAVGTWCPRATEGGHATLSSFRCDFEDTAQYCVSAMNTQGELSAIASIVVKSTLFFSHHLTLTRARVTFPHKEIVQNDAACEKLPLPLHNCKLDMQLISK